jgi:hypothetical protein
VGRWEGREGALVCKNDVCRGGMKPREDARWSEPEKRPRCGIPE